MQQIFSQDSHCNQEANQQNFAEEFINAFDISVFCKNCNTQMTTCDMKLLFSHYLQCEINQQYQDDKCDDSNLNNIKQYFQGNKIKDKEQIENTRTQLDINQLREQILIKSELGQSSKEQYQSTINEYLIKERIQSMSEITNISLMKFLQQEKASLQRINAISQIRKILNLPQTHQICLQYQVLRKQAKSQQTKHPHQPWNLCFIQKVQITFNKFLDDLCRNQKEILAYRIYILYELAARISELKQITFQMILTGQVTYLPNKQRKQGPKAIRNFIISEEVIMQTQIFMNRNKINIANTLNIGYQNQTIKSKSFQKQLRQACNSLLKVIRDENTDYKQFLSKIQYHDLRHTKLSEMHKSEIDPKVIQQFVKHSNIKITEMYLRNIELDSIIDLNSGCVKKNEVGYKSMIMRLNYM